MDKKMIETILSNTYTKTGFLRRMALLRSYLEKKHYSKAKINATSLRSFFEGREVSRVDIEAIDGWVKSWGRKVDGRGFHGVLRSLLEKVSKLPTVTLFLPFHAPDEELVKIGQWFRKHVASDLMVDVRVDPLYVGGCGMVYKGYFKDYSIRRIFKDKKEGIKQLLDEYEEKK